MNCQDIARIVDTGSVARLTEAERDAAAAHAFTCRHCAPVWAAHARLAELRIPPMPAELALRCGTLAAMPDRTGGGTERRRLIVVGAVVALAAAAAILMWYQAGRHSPAPTTATIAAVPVAESASAIERTTRPSPPEVRAPATVPEPVEEDAFSRPLPLVPHPASPPPDTGKAMLALQRAVERHPELVEGPALEGNYPFVVALEMRADGSVLKSAVEMPSATTYDEVFSRLQRMLPYDSIEPLVANFSRDHTVSKGRTLRAGVMLFAALVPDSFDSSRSAARVRDVLGNKYDQLMLSARGEEFNVVTVFLSEDGRVLREKVEHITPQNAGMVLGGASLPMPERIALTLGINVGQIGLTGSTTLEKGGTSMVTDPDGTSRLESTARMLMVRYAWERRANEEAATRASVRTMESNPDFDLAAARVVVERLLPDAFSHAPPSFADMSWPTVVFTAKGEVIRAGRVQMRNGVNVDLLLQEQLVPGIRTGLHRAVRLTDKTGATAMVQFAWAD